MNARPGGEEGLSFIELVEIWVPPGQTLLHINRRIYVQVQNTCFLHVFMLFSAGRGSFLALPVARHVGAPSVHYDEDLGPGRAPRRVL